MSGADGPTLDRVDFWNTAKDKNNVFWRTQNVAMNPKTVRSYIWYVYDDKKTIYTVSYPSFSVLNLSGATPVGPGVRMKDNSKVFSYDIEIVGANASTFVAATTKPGNYDSYYFGIDSTRVYFNEVVVQGADPKTFFVHDSDIESGEDSVATYKCLYEPTRCVRTLK